MNRPHRSTRRGPAHRAPDPRPARSQARLRSALLQLIQRKRWEQIRVQDILDEASVGRSTFYAHFDNKFDLFTSTIPEVLLPIVSTDDDVPDLLPLFEHVVEMRPIVGSLLDQQVSSEVTNAFLRVLSRSWRDHLSQRGVPEARLDVAAQFLAGAFVGVTLAWVADECRVPAQQICDHYSRSAAQVVAEASDDRPSGMGGQDAW